MQEIILTPHQQQAEDEIIAAIKRGINRVILLGSAGTGKTTLANSLSRKLARDVTINPNYNNGIAMITAPTNKALAVLQGKINTRGAEFKTIHSALKLQRYVDEKSGHKKFVPAKLWGKSRREDPFRNCKFCILDECSMLDTHFVGGIVQDKDGNEIYVPGYLESYNFPIIFLGDNKQINPVGEPKGSPVFDKGWFTVELTEIVRQGEGNPIIQLSRDLDLIYFKTPNITSEGNGYYYNESKHILIDDLADVNGTDELKYLALTNTEIDSVNRQVRDRLYKTPHKVEKSEVLVFNSPLESYYTNKEVKVESLEILTDYFAVPKINTKFGEDNQPIGQTDRIKLKCYRVNDSFNIIHEHSQKIFSIIVQTLSENCSKFGWSWRGKYWFEEQFADIKYNHAITVHKSQGSTYKSAIINIGNINFSPNAQERERLLYTAVTRASNIDILHNVK